MRWYKANEDEPEELERLVAAWADAPTLNLEVLGMILEVARDDVIDYAPNPRPESAGEDIKARYVLAQLRQAQSLWDAGSVNSEGEVGEGGFVFVPRPLDKTIKRIIRPTDMAPHVL